MPEHLYEECPVIQQGESVIDFDNLDEEDWDNFDCQVCRFADKLESDVRSNGLVSGLQIALLDLEDVIAARNTGMSKLDIFRRLVLSADPDGTEIKNSPNFHQVGVLIVSENDFREAVCAACQRLVTRYDSTEDSEDIWYCQWCGLEVRINVSSRAIPLRPRWNAAELG